MSGRAYSFSELSTSFLFFLDPYSDYVEVNISLNNFSLLSFLNVYAPLICSLTYGKTNLFSPSIHHFSKNLFILVDFNFHYPLWHSKGTFEPCGEEVLDWVISSDFLSLNNPNIPTLLHCSSGSCSSPDISFAPSSLPFSCSLEVFEDLRFDHIPIQLTIPLSPVLCPNEHPPSFTFRKLAGMTLRITLTLTVPLQRNTPLFPFPLLLLSSLTLNAAKSFNFFGCIKRHPKAWWSA